MTQPPDDPPERTGLRLAAKRSPGRRYWSISLAYHGHPHPSLTPRQRVARAIALDALLAALFVATLMRIGQYDALWLGLAALPLAIIVWAQWSVVRAARRSA